MESFYRQRALRLTLRNVAMTENVKTIDYGKNIAIFSTSTLFYAELFQM